MDLDLIRSYGEAAEPDPDRTPAESTHASAAHAARAGASRPSAEAEEWRGTGLCPQAQADGVPCTELGRTCDLCNSAASDQAARERTRP